MATDMKELKPCPFCGDDGDKGNMEVTQMQTGNKFTRVTCRSCSATAPLSNWNERTDYPGYGEARYAGYRNEPYHSDDMRLVAAYKEGQEARERTIRPATQLEQASAPSVVTIPTELLESSVNGNEQQQGRARNELRTILSARPLNAAPAAAPQGWKLVPVKLSKEMKATLKECAPKWNSESIWTNLLADADKPTEVQS